MKKRIAAKTVRVQLQPKGQVQSMPFAHAVEFAFKLFNEAPDIGSSEFIVKQLLAIKPKEATCRLLLAAIYLRQYKNLQAKAEVDAVLAQERLNPEALNHSASINLLFGRAKQALADAELAVSLAPGSAVLLEKLASIHAQLGNKKASLKAYNAALAKHATPSIYYARSRNNGGQLSDTEREHLESLRGDASLSIDDQACIEFTLASYSRKQQDYTREFDYLHCGNQLMASITPWHFDIEQKKVTAVKEKFARFVAQLDDIRTQLGTLPEASALSPRQPLFIVSMPRSGSTLVESILASHTQVGTVGESEAFAYAIAEIGRKNGWQQNIWQWGQVSDVPALLESLRQETVDYLAHFDLSQSVYCDKSIGSFLTLGLQLLAFPESRVIECQRHPLDICLSAYQIKFTGGNAGSYQLAAMAQSIQLYNDIMAFWKERFPERILTIDYQDIVENTRSTTELMLDFCGLDWQESCLAFYQSVGSITTSSNWQVRQPIYQSSLNRWQQYGALLQPAAEVLNLPVQ